MLIALLSLLVAQSPVANPAGPILSSPSTSGSLAFFEFAPANGAGMGTACACAAITGAKGEAVTFTRTGDATCSRQGLATTGIANGDLVTCSANLPRVESSGGVLGLRVEGARTNSTVRSQQIDNAAWTLGQTGVPGVPTVTADQATAPDGTLTADRVQIPATIAGQNSFAGQTGGCPVSTTAVSSLFVRGNGSSGTMDVCLFTTGPCVSCAFVAGSWSRCPTPSGTTGPSGDWYFGNLTNMNGGTTRSANDVFVWGAQCEAGAYATSYIPTTSAAVTRNAELASVALSPSTVATGSMAISVQLMTTATQGVYVASAGASFQQGLITFGGHRAYVGAVSLVGPLVALGAGQRRLAEWWNGSSTNLILDGASTAGAAGTPAATDTLRIGNYDATAGTIEPGIYSRACYDPDPTRCR